MLAWCHGAPGIGFARLRIRQLLPDDQLLPDEESILAETETAVATTARALTGTGLGNFSLCHGDGGNADMLLAAADLLDRPGAAPGRHLVFRSLRVVVRCVHAKYRCQCFLQFRNVRAAGVGRPAGAEPPA
jgi:hypothetical protein